MIQHAHSLRCLIFDRSILLGSWSTTLDAIARATKGTLELFCAWRVKQLHPDTVFGVDDNAQEIEVKVANFANFTCPVEWSMGEVFSI